MREGRPIRSFAIGAVAGVFLGLIGPFGMSEAPIGLRVGYWVAAILGGTVIGTGLSTAVSLLVDPQGRRPYLLALLTALVMTVPAAGFIYVLTGLAFPHQRLFGAFAGFLGPVFLVCLGMTGLNALAHRTPVETHAAPAGAPPPRFLERLPLKLRGAEIYAVQAEDHYLRLHTSRGSDLILMRLSDAIAELEGLEGAQTHRSWWVAKAAVKDAKRGDGRATLILPGGVAAPVSRSYLPTLREHGWF